MLSAASAGGFGQFLASPTDLVKVRLQTDPSRQKYRGVVHCLQTIHAEAGLRGFYQGWQPNVQRAVLVNVGELLAYDRVKRALLKHTSLNDSLPCHVVASFGAGIFASLCSCPADVIKTRLMQTDSPYKGTIDCLRTMLRTEGFWTLYKGFFPTWMRLGPWQFVFWVTYEQGRKLCGLGGF
jgi:solute carrier family 25 uncoupling protein 27